MKSQKKWNSTFVIKPMTNKLNGYFLFPMIDSFFADFRDFYFASSFSRASKRPLM